MQVYLRKLYVSLYKQAILCFITHSMWSRSISNIVATAYFWGYFREMADVVLLKWTVYVQMVKPLYVWIMWCWIISESDFVSSYMRQWNEVQFSRIIFMHPCFGTGVGIAV